MLANEGKIHVTSSKFGYIGATPFIFNNSLRENLIYGNQNKISDEVLLSKLHEFDLFKRESGYDLDRLVSNKSLSSGQMQK